MMRDETPSRDMRGRGPQGHRRTDARIFEEVCDRLSDAPDVDASDIEVEVADGEVRLAGSVLDRGMRRRADEIAEGIGGVRHVRNAVRVRPHGTADRSGGRGTPVVAAFGLEAQGDAGQEIAAVGADDGERSRTVAALFDGPDEAERALLRLDAAGYDRTSVQVVREDAPAVQETTPGEGGLLGRLKGLFLPERDRDAFAEGLRRGGALVTAVVNESGADEVIGLLQQAGAVDLDARRGEWRATGWREYEPLVEATPPRG